MEEKDNLTLLKPFLRKLHFILSVLQYALVLYFTFMIMTIHDQLMNGADEFPCHLCYFNANCLVGGLLREISFLKPEMSGMNATIQTSSGGEIESGFRGVRTTNEKCQSFMWRCRCRQRAYLPVDILTWNLDFARFGISLVGQKDTENPNIYIQYSAEWCEV